jgi:hypothetical protein
VPIDFGGLALLAIFDLLAMVTPLKIPLWFFEFVSTTSKVEVSKGCS